MPPIGSSAVLLHSTVYEDVRGAERDEIVQLKRRDDHARAGFQGVKHLYCVFSQRPCTLSITTASPNKTS